MAPLLIQISLKASVVLLAAWAATRAMNRCSASARHLVWTLAMVAILILPVVQVAGPRWSVPVLASPPVAHLTAEPVTMSDVPTVADSPAQVEAVRTSVVRGHGDGRSPAPQDWSQIVSGLWLMGLAIGLLRLVAGMVWAGWIARRAAVVTDADWLDALHDISASLGITSRVTLRLSDRTTIPVACGIVKASILLPPDAAKWPDERRRVVLVHELAHVRRRDCLVQTMAQIARAMHWFNPLAHLAVARLRREQERAADDLVLAAGTHAPVYADHLFEIAHSFRRRAFPVWATLAMAEPSQLEGRVLAILDERRNRRPVARSIRAMAAVCSAVVVMAVGALQLTAATAAKAETGSIDPAEQVRGVKRGVSAAVATTTPIAMSQTASSSTSTAPAATSHEPPQEASPDLPVDSAQRLPSDSREAAPWTIDVSKIVRNATQIAAEAVARELAGLDDLDDLDFDFDVDVDVDVDPDQGGSSSSSASRSASASQSSSSSRPPVSDETRRRVADALMTALSDESADVREQAIAGLASLRDPRALPALVKALSDSSADVREHAAMALGAIGDPAAIDPLTTALKDRSADVREMAAMALGQIARGGRRVQTVTPPAPPAPPARPGPNPAPAPAPPAR
jgi:beta-lactamase regulating signal transducer with metallopeptidase domain